MNYSTLKKTAALSFASLVVVGAANAQSMKKDSSMMAPGTTSAKVFGGRAQYRTWSIGVNAGILSPFVAIGGTNDFANPDLKLGYGISIRKQLAHSFSLELDGIEGHVAGDNGNTAPGINPAGVSSFTTYVPYAVTLSGVVNVATIDFIRRKNAVNFFVSAGGGLVTYNPILNLSNGTSINNSGNHDISSTSGNKYARELVIPIGVGVKFKLTDRVAFNLGYTADFVDGNYFDGTHSYNAPGEQLHKDKYSYGYGGFEFSLGSSSKPNMDWVNPVAMMYDELYDAPLRAEVAALKGRVANVESAVNDLKKDSDGDGVADQFDKCPNTPAGTVVDGSGCPIKFPPPIDTSLFMRKPTGPMMAPATAYSNIQFEFDSSVLRTSSYPILDATSADLRSGKKSVMVEGFASSEGTAAHNLQLSKDRANSVKTYLVNSGVDAKRVKVKGYGETHPIADNSTEDGRVLNRRVQFKK